uniref:NADH dehydrogenase [ubiquinone] 1 alpha subcomplex subunit 5 n=1 Tax=Felis catus TaxID=9685 RepID=A0ABI7ZQL5_FELCA
MAGLLRKTTSLVGLAVCEGPPESLRVSYTKILDVLEQIPKNAAYSKYIEWITNEKWDCFACSALCLDGSSHPHLLLVQMLSPQGCLP